MSIFKFNRFSQLSMAAEYIAQKAAQELSKETKKLTKEKPMNKRLSDLLNNWKCGYINDDSIEGHIRNALKEDPCCKNKNCPFELIHDETCIIYAPSENGIIMTYPTEGVVVQEQDCPFNEGDRVKFIGGERLLATDGYYVMKAEHVIAKVK